MNSIDIKSFADKIRQRENLYLLDVRKEADYRHWTLTGENLSTFNLPLDELNDHKDEWSSILTADHPVYVLCYNGALAQKAVAILEEAGYTNLLFVEGGIGKWGEYIEPVKIDDLSNGGAIYQFIRFGKGCLSYMIVSANEALVVDPARTIDSYLAFAEKNGWKIKAVADTHLHADHISGGRKLAEVTGASYWFTCKDGDGIRFSFNRMEDGLRIPLGNGKEAVFSFSTPGHTPGSMSLLVDDTYLLCGDCLFIESIGRPDSIKKNTEWARALRTTLFEAFTQLPGKLVVLPGHFNDYREIDSQGRVQSTLGNLYSSNKFLQLETEDEFLKTIIDSFPEPPTSYQDIRRINIGIHELSLEDQQQIESGHTHRKPDYTV